MPTQILYIIWVADLKKKFITKTHVLDQKWGFQHPFSLGTTMLVLYKDFFFNFIVFIRLKNTF